MSVSKFVIGGVFVVVAAVALVPLFKSDISGHFQAYNNEKSAFLKPFSKQNDTDVIGTVNGHPLKRSELSAQENQSLFDAQTQVYKANESILAKRYFESIIEKYAKEKAISDTNLAQQQFIQDNIKIDDSEIKAFIQNNGDNPQLKGKNYSQQVELVRPYLFQQAASNYFKTVVAQAKKEGLIKVTAVALPEAQRVKIDVGNSPSQGPKNAPIQMIEFADYQCPFCYSTEPTVKKLMDKYKDKIHFVFKSYPLFQIHPQAMNAALAAQCANEQGQFWQMHDVLFLNHAKLSDAVYLSYAKNLNLDVAKFQTCFNSSATKSSVMADADYGQSLGINATPAFYINGVLIMGAQPYSEFENAIEKELKN